ncbi:MAG: hypothetical protein GY749_20405 [Desulfobacteraceae bacterium]|nr:hypothetical protein [Desulfobacteraceae bacterium]
MQLTIDISEKILIEFGRASVQKEIDNTLKWMKIKQDFRKISKELKSSFDEQDYYKKVEKIKECAWNEYKKKIS